MKSADELAVASLALMANKTNEEQAEIIADVSTLTGKLHDASNTKLRSSFCDSVAGDG